MPTILKPGDIRAQHDWILTTVISCDWCGCEYQLTRDDKLVDKQDAVTTPEQFALVKVNGVFGGGLFLQTKCPQCKTMNRTKEPEPEAMAVEEDPDFGRYPDPARMRDL